MNIQVVGAPREVLVSQVSVSIATETNTYPDVTFEVRQPLGDDFADGPLQVIKPDAYDGPWGFAEFQNAVERHYRSVVGPHGRGVRFDGRGPMTMVDCSFSYPERVTLDLPAARPGGGGW